MLQSSVFIETTRGLFSAEVDTQDIPRAEKWDFERDIDSAERNKTKRQIDKLVGR